MLANLFKAINDKLTQIDLATAQAISEANQASQAAQDQLDQWGLTIDDIRDITRG